MKRKHGLCKKIDFELLSEWVERSGQMYSILTSQYRVGCNPDNCRVEELDLVIP